MLSKIFDRENLSTMTIKNDKLNHSIQFLGSSTTKLEELLLT